LNFTDNQPEVTKSGIVKTKRDIQQFLIIRVICRGNSESNSKASWYFHWWFCIGL